MFLCNWVCFMRSGHFCVGWWYNEMKCEEMYEENEEHDEEDEENFRENGESENDASKK